MSSSIAAELAEAAKASDLVSLYVLGVSGRFATGKVQEIGEDVEGLSVDEYVVGYLDQDQLAAAKNTNAIGTVVPVHYWQVFPLANMWTEFGATSTKMCISM